MKKQVSFDVSRKWFILMPSGISHARKAAEDISRCIGLLAGEALKAPAILDAFDPAPQDAIFVLSASGGSSGRNGFAWRAGDMRVEISGESGRGLCNGIYSFLAALGISWPAPGQENLPAANPAGSWLFPLNCSTASEASHFEGDNPAAAPLRRFVLDEKTESKNLLNKSEDFAAWAARNSYDAIVFPLAAYASESRARKLKQLGQIAGEYGIVLEAGGRDFSSLVPRKHFFLHRDFFRMKEGVRSKDHHFCPTNPGALKLLCKEGEKLFGAAREARVFHLWPDKGAETAWCSCPSCRAFTPQEQNLMGVNAAADVLAVLNPEAFITYFEKSGEDGKIPFRKNVIKMERLPEEKESP
jgi:hypothetical protein